jgi:hypothetical protein
MTRMVVALAEKAYLSTIMDWIHKSRVTEWNGEKTCPVEVDQKVGNASILSKTYLQLEPDHPVLHGVVVLRVVSS